MDAPTDWSWNATSQHHQRSHLGDGLYQFAQPTVTKQGQCASAEKEQNIHLDHWQRHVGFNLSM
jgi:hypothetical protein